MDPSVENDQARAARRVGTVVGRYRLERVLGVGGMGAVYVGRTHEGFLAAIKILHDDMSVRRDVRERFYREGYVANSVQHPGVVRVLEHGDGGGDAFLAMELLSGETLSERARRLQALPVSEVLEVADQVLDVLRAAHEKGIIHRDLKPDNLFLTHSGQIKILDFGLARLAESAPGEQRTRSGVALGTLPYMAPEQALGRRAEIDGRVDLFALGATLFRLLSGRRIHEAPSEAELLIAMATQPAPPLIGVAPHVPLDLCRIIDLSLAFSRDARYPSAETMQNDVRAVRAGQHPPYALARLSHRDEKTRMEPAVPEIPVSSARGPQGTVPLAVHQANLGATLGGQVRPHQLAQTYPSAVAPHVLARTVPSAGVASEPQVAVVGAPVSAASLGQTRGPGVQLQDVLQPQPGAPAPHTFGPAVQAVAALGQTYPSAGQPAEAQRAPAALGQTYPSASPVEVVVKRAPSAADLAQTFPSAQSPAAAPVPAYAPPGNAGMYPQAPGSVGQAPPYAVAPNTPAAAYAQVPPTAPAPVAPPRTPKPAARKSQPLLWVLALLGLLVSAGVALALVTLIRKSTPAAPTPRTSSSALAPPSPVVSAPTTAAPLSAPPASTAPGSTATTRAVGSAPPVVELAPSAPAANTTLPRRASAAPRSTPPKANATSAASPAASASPAPQQISPPAAGTVPLSDLK
ncbi:MAG: protein kinase domain-containing protein [Myxococcota bacterium]